MSRKGIPNKVTGKARELAEKLGVDPLEILLYFASGDWKALGYKSGTKPKAVGEDIIQVDIIHADLRIKGAQEAAKYIYPTQKAVEHSGDQAGFKIILEDYEQK